jgi:hypothetical protein
MKQSCQWHIACTEPAQWQKRSEILKDGVATYWLLCDQHKDYLLSCYNAEFRQKDGANWKRIDGAM